MTRCGRIAGHAPQDFMIKTSNVNNTFCTQWAAFNSNSDVAGQGQLGSGQLGSGQGSAMSGEQR